MVVLTALRSALVGLGRNPVVLLAAGVLALGQLPQLAVGTLEPPAATAVSALSSLLALVLTPFFHAGLYGMADDAIGGRTRVRTFLAAGRAHYVPMLIAYLLLFAVVVAVGIVSFVVSLVVLLLVLAAGVSPSVDAIGLAAVVALVATVVLPYLVALFFVQFYGQAIVVDDLGAVEAYRRSVRLVRRNLLATLGYSLLTGVLLVVSGGVGGLAGLLLSPESVPSVALPSLGPAEAVATAAVVVAVSALVGAVHATFSVAFYRGLSAGSETGPDARAAAD